MSSDLPLGGFFENLDMLGRRAMAGFAIDARLRPGGMVGVGFQVVVGGELAHVAVVAHGVEGERPLPPVERFVPPVEGMAKMAGGGVVPDFAVDIIGKREDLKAARFQWGSENKRHSCPP